MKKSTMMAMVLGVIVMSGLSSCNKDKTLDFNDQLAKDESTIDSYLAAHKVANVIKDNSGVRYTVTSVGTGLIPAPNSMVMVKYTASILGNSTSFDSNDGIFLDLSQVVKAWQVILPLMTKGSKFTIYAPSGLAYGEVGVSGVVPANANLEFDIELYDDDAQLKADLVTLDHYIDSLENALHIDVFADPRGIRYYRTINGTGSKPVSTNNITVTYTGRTLDGKTFATQTNEVTVPMSQLMPAWQDALPAMAVGTTFTLFVPSTLGYGPAGYSSAGIGPNENLIFDITLLDVN